MSLDEIECYNNLVTVKGGNKGINKILKHLSTVDQLGIFLFLTVFSPGVLQTFSSLGKKKSVIARIT